MNSGKAVNLPCLFSPYSLFDRQPVLPYNNKNSRSENPERIIIRKQSFIEKLIEGSLNQKELTISDLPHNRRQVYKHLILNRFGTLFSVGFFNALFWLPLFGWYYFSGFYVMEKLKSSDPSQVAELLGNLMFLEYGTMVPLFCIGALGLAGMFYVIRRMCWGESVSLVHDFKKGIKQSWKQFLLIGFLFGVAVFILEYLLHQYSLKLYESALVNVMLYAGTIIIYLLAMMQLIFAFPMSSLYWIGNFSLFKGSISFTFRYFPKNLLIFLISLFPFLVFIMLPSVLFRFIGILVFLLFGAMHTAVIWTLYSHSVFDKHINRQDYPDYVNKGINPLEEQAESNNDK